MNWPWLQVLVVFVTPGLAYYHEQSQRVFKVSLHPDANFGFSISSMSNSSMTKLIVGAPLADDIGEVYTCDLTKNPTNECTAAKRSIKRFVENDKYNNQSYWYGATVKGTDNLFVACAPLNIDKSYKFVGEVGTFGRCYSYKDPKRAPDMLKPLSTTIRMINFHNFEETIDSFGWSLDIDSENSILIGGPAMISGRVIKTKPNQLLYTYGAQKNKTEFNFGYAVASGYFLSATKLSVAVGSPYGIHGYGKVSLLAESSSTLAFKKELPGTVVGSMFGAVLCAATLRAGRHNADLLVGAPAFADKERYNVGAVYVYIATPKPGPAPIYKRMIVGAMSQSFFGSAIVSVGDLNGDRMDEIAIAAPYENEDRGAVYLYSGAAVMSEGNIGYLQKFRPEPSLKTFGYSLAALNDYDDNGCNELAIGTPGSNQVKVLRCMAAITIKLLKFKVEMPGHKGKDEIRPLAVCFTAEFPDKLATVKADIQVKIVIQHDGARLNDDSTDGLIMFNIRAKQDKPYCKNINIFMNATAGNYNKKIMYGISASLMNNPVHNVHFDGSEVLLTERSVLHLKGSLWVQECGDKLCVPELKMNTTFSENSGYKLGSSPSIDAEVLVTNTGNVAYDACVRVHVTGATVPHPPAVCRAVDSAVGELLECKPKQPLLQGNPPWSPETISVDTTLLTNEDKAVTVNVTLYNECARLDAADHITKVIPLFADAESINVEGHTNEGVDDMVNLTRNDIATQKSFQHVYTISNSGLTNWVNVKMVVIVQKRDFLTSSVALEGNVCLLVSDMETEAEYSCVAPRLNKDAGIHVKVIMHPVPDELDGIIGKMELTVNSTIKVELSGTSNPTKIVISKLRLEEAVIPIWIIIAASILALIILLVIFFILRECGFLKRQNKEELKRARMSVRRQTMMRQSMLNRPQSQDQEKLVEDNEAASSQENKKKKKDRRVVINDF